MNIKLLLLACICLSSVILRPGYAAKLRKSASKAQTSIYGQDGGCGCVCTATECRCGCGSNGAASSGSSPSSSSLPVPSPWWDGNNSTNSGNSDYSDYRPNLGQFAAQDTACETTRSCVTIKGRQVCKDVTICE